MVDLVVLVLHHFSDVELLVANFANLSTLQTRTLRERLCLVPAARAKCFRAELAIFYIFKAFVCVVAASALTTFDLLRSIFRTRQFENGVIVKIFKEHVFGWTYLNHKVLILLP